MTPLVLARLMPRLRRLVLALLAAALLAGCAAQPLAPAAALDPAPDAALPSLAEPVAALRDALLEGGRVKVEAEPAYLLPLDPRNRGAVEVELELTRSALVDEATWAEVDGERVPLPWIETYEGHLAGDPGAPARLTLASSFAAGSVRIGDVAYRIRVNTEGNFPMGADWDAVEKESAQMQAKLLSPSWTFDKDGVEPHDCLSLVPVTATPVVHREGFTGADKVVHIVLDTDAEMNLVFGDDAWPLAVAQLNEVEAIYHHQVGIRFHVVGLHAHTDKEALSDPEDETPLGDLAAYWNKREDVDRDIVHLITGHPSSYAQANCIGGAGMPEIAYTFTTIHWAKESYGKNRHVQTFAHELGHIFNAHHHYGNAVEGALGTTIMHQGGEKINPVFSTLSRSVIRGWTEAHVD